MDAIKILDKKKSTTNLHILNTWENNNRIP